jgi:hypothetical protein
VDEQRLPGGYVNEVVRVGDTVRRRPGDRADFVHRLLDHFARHDWPGAPRFLGLDGQGREILTFVDGHVPWDSPSDVCSADGLARVARLVRQCHDLTAGTPQAGGHEVVCHNDLSPKNTVYADRGSRPIAFVDWDIAAPGSRIHDVAHVCWQYVDLGPAVVDARHAADLVRVICDAYGPVDRTRVVDTVLWWQDRCRRGIESAADAGDLPMTRLRDAGVVTAVRAAHDWVLAHRAVLEQALTA